ncbi:MAG: UbiD family decarboxylase [Candidatus Thermoplasmatota archaeon]|nr:UbiD family decarboxylase [Candidatus Thermoplasmatota archaeon]
MQFRDLLSGNAFCRLNKPVDPYIEASSICREDLERPWFSPAKGHDGLFLAGNVLSSRSAFARALGTTVDGISDMLLRAMEGPQPCELVDRPPGYHEVDVGSIPIPTYFKSDGGPYVTSGIFHAGFEGKFNLSFHRMMYMGGDKFAVRVVPRHLNALLQESEACGKKLYGAVSIGTDPAALIAGSVTLTYGKDEMEVASSMALMTGEGPLRTFSPIDDEGGPRTPVGTEIVLYGYFTGERTREGPFVDITSTVDLSGISPGEPVFKVEKALAREGAIMHVLLPGGYEHYLMMGLPKEPSIMQSVKKVVPRVKAVRLTEGGCCWLHGIVSIAQQKEGDSKNAIMAAFTGHPSMKRVIVVDDDIDIFDDRQVEWALATRFQAHRDMFVVEGARGSTLDPSADTGLKTTSKLGLDSCMPLSDRERFLRVG